MTPSLRVDGKVAVVTGGGQGIGLHMPSDWPRQVHLSSSQRSMANQESTCKASEIL
jgi:NAD(P)-dependent dehydrogenase (short-subunit alcohol dehydrogenase family)